MLITQPLSEDLNYWLESGANQNDSIEDAKHLYRDSLTQSEVEVFNKIVNGIQIETDGTKQFMLYMGRYKRIQRNPYLTILNDVTWTTKQKKKWTTYVMDTFHNIDEFNKYVHTRQSYVLMNDYNKVCFFNESQFNLLVSNYEVYIKLYPDCNQVKLLCNLNDPNAKRIIFNHIKLNLYLKCMKNIKSDQKVYDVFLEEIAGGYHKVLVNPITLSNNNEVYCLTYIPLNYNIKKETPMWDMFIEQISTELMKKQIMSWIYSIFVDKDFNRQVLWVQGQAQTWKTTVANIIGEYLSCFNPSMVAAMAKIETQYSFAQLANSRLVIYSDANDNKFFQRKDVLNLTGNDTVYFEEKYKNPESKKVYAKIMVTSNYAPSINLSKDFETSRLLHITMNQNKVKKIRRRLILTSQAQKKAFKEELPYFLAKCKAVYEDKND